MASREPRYAAEEHARRGREVYEQRVQSQVEADNHGRITAIDIDSGKFDVAETTLAACEQLLARVPGAQIWCVRVGHPAVHRLGSHVAMPADHSPIEPSVTGGAKICGAIARLLTDT